MRFTLHHALALKGLLPTLGAASGQVALELDAAVGTCTLSSVSLTLAVRAVLPAGCVAIEQAPPGPLVVRGAHLADAIAAIKEDRVHFSLDGQDRVRLRGTSTEMLIAQQEPDEAGEQAGDVFRPPDRDVVITMEDTAAWTEALGSVGCTGAGLQPVRLAGDSARGSVQLATGGDDPACVERRAVIRCGVSADFTAVIGAGTLAAIARPPADTRMRIAVCERAGLAFTVWWLRTLDPRAPGRTKRRRDDAELPVIKVVSVAPLALDSAEFQDA